MTVRTGQIVVVQNGGARPQPFLDIQDKATTDGEQDDIGVYDPATAVFRLRNSLSAGNPDAQFRFGLRRQGWKPIAGSW